MIQKLQKNNQTVYLIFSNLNINKSKLEDLIVKIREEKKIPFNDVYVMVPFNLLNQFIELLWNKNLKVKESNQTKNTMMLKM